MDDYTRRLNEIAARLKDGAPAKPSPAKPSKPRPAPMGPGWLIVPAGKVIEAVALSNELVPLSFHGESVCMLDDCPGCDGNAVQLWFYPAFVPSRNTLVRAYLFRWDLLTVVRGEIIRYQRNEDGAIFTEAMGEFMEGELPPAWNIKADLMGAKRLPHWPGERATAPAGLRGKR